MRNSTSKRSHNKYYTRTVAPIKPGWQSAAVYIDFHTQMELPFHYLMLKQAPRIKYALRAALCGAGMYSRVTRGSRNLPPPGISLFSEELPIRAQRKKKDLRRGPMEQKGPAVAVAAGPRSWSLGERGEGDRGLNWNRNAFAISKGCRERVVQKVIWDPKAAEGNSEQMVILLTLVAPGGPN